MPIYGGTYFRYLITFFFSNRTIFNISQELWNYLKSIQNFNDYFSKMGAA